MVATTLSAPSSLAGPSAPGRRASRIASDRRGATWVSPERAVFEPLARAGGTCIGRARPHRRDAHRGRRRFSGQTHIGRYSWARYYHPTLQRFISEDPIGFLGGDANLYRYVWGSPTNYIDPLGYGVMDRGIDWIASKALKFPKFPVMIFIPVTALEVVAKGPCVIPKRLVQAGAAYLGSWAGGIAGAELGFVVGEIIVPTGGGVPGAFVGWAVGGVAGSGAAALGAGFLYDAVVPGGDCTVPPASGNANRSKSSS